MSTETVAIATQEDTGSQLWKKKYTLLLKKTENIDKQNLRLINRTYQITRITKRLRKEQRLNLPRYQRTKLQYQSIKQKSLKNHQRNL